MNKVRHAFFGCDPRSTFSTFDLARFERVLTRLPKHADTVHDSIRSSNYGSGRRIIPDIALNWFNLSDDAVRFHEHRFVRASTGNAHPPSASCHALSDIAPQKSGAADDRDEFALCGHADVLSYLPLWIS